MSTVMTSNQIDSPEGIRNAYEGRDTAQKYVAERFVSELTRLQHERQVAAINRAFQLRKAQDVLEIACGPGRLTRDVRLPSHLSCLEYNAGMLEEARQNCPAAIRWIRGDAFSMPFESQFDLVYTFRFIRHFRLPDRRRLYDQVHRALRPDGWLVMDAVNAVVSGPVRAANPADYPVYDKLYDRLDDLRGELAESGFELVTAEPVLTWYPAQFRAQVLLGPRSSWLCRTAIRMLEKLRSGPALEWIVTCRRA
jgi:SAM-dependent methyltransferase